MNEKNQMIKNLGYILPYLAIVTIIFVFIFIYSKRLFNLINYSVLMSIPIILSSIFLLKFYKTDVIIDKIIFMFHMSQKNLMQLFIIFYIFSSISLFLSYDRHWLYFVGITVLYIILFMQIFSNNYHPTYILFEIMFVMINFIYGVTLKYPLYFGFTDIMPHINFSQIIYTSGHTLPGSYLYYTQFPLYHILIAESSHLLNLDIQTSIFVITGPVFVILTVFLYYIFKKATENSQISLLACLLYSSSSIVLFSGTYVVTRTLAYWGFIILFYLLHKQSFENGGRSNNILYLILAMIFIIFIILVHQVSAVLISIIMSIFLLCEYFVGSKKYLSSIFLVIFNVTFIAYWFYEAHYFISTVLTERLKYEFFKNPELIQSINPASSRVSEYSFLSLINEKMDTYILLFFILIGIGYTLWRQKPKYATVFGIFSMFIIVFYIENPFITMWQTSKILGFARLKLLVSPFISLSMSVGIIAFYNYFQNNTINQRICKLLILFSVIFFVSFSVVYSVKDSNIFQTNTSRQYFNEQEIFGFDYVTNHFSLNDTIYSDYHSTIFLKSKNKSSEMISDVEELSKRHGYSLIRNGEFLDNGLSFNTPSPLLEYGTYLFAPTKINRLSLSENVSKSNKIYSNDALILYYLRSN